MQSDNLLQKAAEGLTLFGKLIKDSFVEFKKNDPLRMAGATAFFTTFALPPILFIIVQLFGFFVDRKAFAINIMTRLSAIIGPDSVGLIRQTIRNARGLNSNWMITVLGFLFLVFVATTLFVVIKDSLDQIWCIKVKPGAGLWFRLKQRARSFGIILLAGLLFTSGLVIEAARAFLGQYLEDFDSGYVRYLNSALNEVLFALIVMLWFTVLFRYITDGRPRWKNAFYGALFTSILFTAGKLTIRFFLLKSNIQLIYNSSGSLVLILLFVFYSSMIFYYGGCFVKIISDHQHEPIRPIHGAYKFELKEIETHEQESS
ncbi:MAG: ribonuclease [Sphingobacteriaceae bacterium]|jgi:membrane protein|nr:ribonuclease [Sphingobacteriaceae bacterium]